MIGQSKPGYLKINLDTNPCDSSYLIKDYELSVIGSPTVPAFIEYVIDETGIQISWKTEDQAGSYKIRVNANLFRMEEKIDSISIDFKLEVRLKPKLPIAMEVVPRLSGL